MTPAETIEWIDGWNASQEGGQSQPEAPTMDEYMDLVKRYG